MDSSLVKHIRSILDGKKKSKRKKRGVALASAFVLGSTGIIMSLPASTATPELLCGKEEHRHTQECYTQEKDLVCMQEEYAGHHHTDACYAQQRILVCGEPEYEGHYHSEYCYDEEGNLVCGMQELPGHTHTDDCYMTISDLVCGQVESEGHTHTDACYETRDVVTCGKEEHIHSAECYEQGGMLSSQTEDEMIAELTYDAGEIHNDTSFSAKLLKEQEAEQVQKLTEEFLEKSGKVCSAFHPYQLSLTKDDQEVTPDGVVNVRWVFRHPVTFSDQDMKWRILEINDKDEVRDITKDENTKIKVNENTEITELFFETGKPARYALIGAKKVEAEEPAVQETPVTESEPMAQEDFAAETEQAEVPVEEAPAVDEHTEEVAAEPAVETEKAEAPVEKLSAETEETEVVEAETETDVQAAAESEEAEVAAAEETEETEDSDAEISEGDEIVEDADDADKPSEETTEEESEEEKEKTDEDDFYAEEKEPLAPEVQEELDASTEDTYVYSDDFVTVTATLTDPKAIPDSAEFVVTPVTSESFDYCYDAYMEALNNSDSEKTYTDENTLLYDIRFLYEEKLENDETRIVEFQPQAGTVQIDFTFHQNQLKGKDENAEVKNVEVVHLPIDEEIKEENGNLTAGADVTADDIAVETLATQEVDFSGNSADTVSFETDGFTVFAFNHGGPQTGAYWSGDKEFSIEYLLSRLGEVTDFGIYVNSLLQEGHLEANIKVGKLEIYQPDGQLNQVDDVENRNKIQTITVTKTVDEKSSFDRSFKFGVYKYGEKIGDKIAEFDIIVRANETSASKELTEQGELKNIFNVLNYEKSNISIYEEKEGSPVLQGGEVSTDNKKYKVSYYYNGKEGNNVIVSSYNPAQYNNFIGSIKMNCAYLVDHYFYGKLPEGSMKTYIHDFSNPHMEQNDLVFTSDGNVRIQNYGNQQKQADKAEDLQKISLVPVTENIAQQVQDKLNDLGTLSVELANSKFGAQSGVGSLSVLNIYGKNGNLTKDMASLEQDYINSETDIINGVTIKDTINENGYLLINIDATDCNGVYTLNQFTIDGRNAEDGPNGEKEELARHLIINLVQREGENYVPYKGIVEVDNVTAGTILAPCATVKQAGGGIRGLVIANVFNRINSGGKETHKSTLTTPTRVQFNVHNETVKEVVSVSGTKIWEDSVNQAAIRPEKIQINLMAGSEQAKDEKGNIIQKEVTAADNWEYSFTELPKYDESGKEIVYSVQEVSVPGYITEYDTKNPLNIKNTLETVSITAKKNWEDNEDVLKVRPTNIKIYVYDSDDQDKKPIAGTDQTITANDNWTYTYTNLPKWKKDGDQLKEINYQIMEEDIEENYSVSYDVKKVVDESKPNEYTQEFTNTLKKMDFTFTKIWKDDKTIIWPSNISIEVILHAEFVPQEVSEISEKKEYKYTIAQHDGIWEIQNPEGANAPTCIISSSENKKYKFVIQGLPRTDKKGKVNGKWNYYVTENQVTDYKTSYASLSGDEFTSSGDMLHANNGDAIINTEDQKYELPSTGGSGINKYIYSGLALMIIALLGIVASWSRTGRRSKW